MKLAILISGSGTNLQAIIDAKNNGDLPNIELSLVIADRDCYGIERALEAEIPTFFVDRGENLSPEIHDLCEIHEIELIVLAGFLSILSAELCEKWDKKIINLHPALLPKYGGKGMYGKKVHQAVLANNEKESGATVHYVTAGIDEGEIIAQKAFAIKPGENVDWLAKKISEIEKPLLIEAIKKISSR